MSIYQSRTKRPIKDDEVTQPVTTGGTREPARGTAAGEDWAQIWAHRRKAMPPKHLLPMSIRWLTNLPNHVRPLALVNNYPRIANLLALQWGKPPACRAYFIDLLMDRRGNRKGFPADVRQELRVLRDYYYDLNPPSPNLALVE